MVQTLDTLLGRVSVSRLETAQRCLAKFCFDYVERRPRAFSVASSFGNAADDCANVVYRSKRRTGETPSRDDVAERFAAAWDYEAGAIEDWGDTTRGKLLDTGTKGMGVWRDRIAAFIEPTEAQETITKTVEDPATGDRFELTGALDLRGIVQGRRVVADLKTSGRRYRADVFSRRMQPTAYTLLAGVPTFEYHVVTKTKEPQTQVLRCSVPDTARDHFLRTAGMIRRQVAHAFRAGDWLPNRTHTLCSRRYCDHWRECEQRHGGTVAP